MVCVYVDGACKKLRPLGRRTNKVRMSIKSILHKNTEVNCLVVLYRIYRLARAHVIRTLSTEVPSIKEEAINEVETCENEVLEDDIMAEPQMGLAEGLE